MAKKSKKLKFKDVFYQRNVDLGLDENCKECVSHSKDVGGYPRFAVNKKSWKVHRYIFYKETNTMPEVVMHLCDNPACSNIKHLKAGTYKDNNNDAFNKGRRVWVKNENVKGEQNASSKLTNYDIKFIREWLKLGYSQSKIAKVFGVAQSQISKIKLGKTWAHVDGGV